MLLTDFYKIDNIDFNSESGEIKGSFYLNPNHEVYQGHFPNQPVAPGVMQIQIIKEICEQVLNKTLFISESNVVKFINMIIPKQNESLLFTIKIKEHDNCFNVDCSIVNKELTIFKAKLVLK